jgi:hypothetical protein
VRQAILAALISSCALGASALAQSLVVEAWSGGTMNSQNTYSSGASFTIPLISSTNRINIYSTGGLADIGTISFSGSTSQTSVDVVIGSGALNADYTINLSNAADDWAGVAFPFNARLSGAIAGNLSGSINPVSIVRLEAHGQVSGAISASTTTGTSIGLLQLGATTSGGTITAGKNIVTIELESSTTSMAGAVSAGGSIGTIMAAGDILISSGGIQAADGITLISAEDISAAIDVNTANHVSPSTLGTLYYLECDAFSGSLSARQIGNTATPGQDTAISAGVISAPISTTENLVWNIEAASFASTADITVGGVLKGSITSTGDIQDIVAGSIFGDAPVQIVSSSGEIGSITTTGDIWSDGPAGVHINAASGIGSITCADLTHVTIGEQTYSGASGVAVGTTSAPSGIPTSTRSLVAELWA